MRSPNFHHYLADAHDIRAQVDLIGMPWLMIREGPISRADRRLGARSPSLDTATTAAVASGSPSGW
jgi:hypothetical protein